MWSSISQNVFTFILYVYYVSIQLGWKRCNLKIFFVSFVPKNHTFFLCAVCHKNTKRVQARKNPVSQENHFARGKCRKWSPNY